jgi:hypothetical protein
MNKKNGLNKVKDYLIANCKDGEVKLTNKEIGLACGLTGQVAGYHVRNLIACGCITTKGRSTYSIPKAAGTAERQHNHTINSAVPPFEYSQPKNEYSNESIAILLNNVLALLQQLLSHIAAEKTNLNVQNSKNDYSIEQNYYSNEYSQAQNEYSNDYSIEQNNCSNEQSATNSIYIINNINKKKEKEKEKKKESSDFSKIEYSKNEIEISYSRNCALGNGIKKSGMPTNTGEIDEFIDWDNANIQQTLKDVYELFPQREKKWHRNLTKRLIFGIVYSLNGFDAKTLKQKAQEIEKHVKQHDLVSAGIMGKPNLMLRSNPYCGERWKLVAAHVRVWLREAGVVWTSTADTFREEVIYRGNSARASMSLNQKFPLLEKNFEKIPPQPIQNFNANSQIKNLSKSLACVQ